MKLCNKKTMTLVRSVPLPAVHIRHHAHRSFLALTACFFLLFCSTAQGGSTSRDTYSENAAKVVVEFSPLDNATFYTISSGDCMIQWIARNAEPGVIKHRSQCAAPLAQQLPLLTKICAEFFSSDKNTRAFRTLFWGTLEPDQESASREMSLRLALNAPIPETRFGVFRM